MANDTATKLNIVQLQKESGDSLLSARDRLKNEIIKSGEAKAISDQLIVTDMTSIVEFGKPVSEQMSKVADEVLRRSNTDRLSDTEKFMSSLTKIMDKVDLKEIESTDKSEGWLSKVFNSAQRKLEQLMAKYDNIGRELENVCIELRTYEAQITQSNSDLQALYENGVENYKMLSKYTIAGEMAMVELDEYIENLTSSDSGMTTTELDLNSLNYAKQLLSQRVQDLRLAESVALQSLPMLKAIEFGNMNLARKINSAFIITIPVFKNAIAQAMFIKQQSLQAKAMKALDDATNEMLIKNSKNVADTMKQTAALAGKSSIDIETLETSWNNIMGGIKDTKAIQEELAKQREVDKAKLEELSKKYLSQVTQ